jgi:signal transduction histidine kinase
MTWPIVTMPIETEADVVGVRQRARLLAERLGFERQDQTRVATAVSEIARNAFSYAGGGRAEFLIESESSRQVFVIRISDQGKGIADLDAVLEGRVRSEEGMGLGLVGARRLMDQFQAASQPGKGTTITLGQIVPSRAEALTRAMLADVTRDLSGNQTVDPLALVRDQNRELLQSLEEIRRRQEEAEELNRELSDTNRGVVALYAELDERAEQLRQASELKSRFLSNMSHEFRTPLNSILALSRLLLDRVDGDLNPEQEKQVGYIRRSAEGLLELVNDLLDLAKVEAGKAEVKPVPFSVPELFGALRGALRPLHANAAVDLIFESGPDIPELFTDEPKVAQILRNLISNALKFTEVGEVRVSAAFEPHAGSVTFAVCDTGIGIAPEDQERIFEEFSQVDTRLHRKVKGTGLGLSLSRTLARLLGGEIVVESVPGQGSVFRLSLPASLVDEASARGPAERTSKHVLVIDDDETFRYVFRQLISGDARYEVHDAADGAEGLRRAREERPDLIILDLQMPHVDGFSVLNELAADNRTAAIPIVITTSLNVTPELRARLPAGMNILSKEDLSRETVSMLLREATESRLVS